MTDYLKASNTNAGDEFGDSVALSGSTLAAAAWFEASNATGVNGNQADNSAPNSGASTCSTGCKVIDERLHFGRRTELIGAPPVFSVAGFFYTQKMGVPPLIIL